MLQHDLSRRNNQVVWVRETQHEDIAEVKYKAGEHHDERTKEKEVNEKAKDGSS